MSASGPATSAAAVPTPGIIAGKAVAPPTSAARLL
jgi:hypothetical protein